MAELQLRAGSLNQKCAPNHANLPWNTLSSVALAARRVSSQNRSAFNLKRSR